MRKITKAEYMRQIKRGRRVKRTKRGFWLLGVR
jgi:hypothetical protein